MTLDISYLNKKFAELGEEAILTIGVAIAQVQTQFAKAGQPASERCKLYVKQALSDGFKAHLHKVAQLCIELGAQNSAEVRTSFIEVATRLAQKLTVQYTNSIFGNPAFDKNAQYKAVTETPSFIASLCNIAKTVADDMARNVVGASVIQTPANERKAELIQDLQPLKIHPDVLKYCNDELLKQDYFHAVSEAVKGLAEKIRHMASVSEDGSKLADKVFSGTRPIIAINSMASESEQSEQTGFLNFVKGVFGMFRNPTAHTPKTSWLVDKESAEEVFTILSLIHKRIDAAAVNKGKKD